MPRTIQPIIVVLLCLLIACTKTGTDASPSSSSAIATAPPTGSGNQSQSGVITAGEWDDLEHWDFWKTIIQNDTFKMFPAYWNIYTVNRVSVHIVDTDSLPIIDVAVRLQKDGQIIFSARTDNRGNAELWTGLFQDNTNPDYSALKIDINNGAKILNQVKSLSEGINQVILPPVTVENNIDIAFVVDATGSMGDELEYLKKELLDVISRAQSSNHNTPIWTASVFYRDEGDDYLTKVSDFTTDYNTTIDFIKDQRSDGGGDVPEAVHAALDKAVNMLQWSTHARTRLLFLVLDAPPHYESAVIRSIQASIQTAATKGIKIIPVTASGIDKETEFLMRFFSISTNGTYVFITDDSGIGESHLRAAVGPYEVEYLNNLMVRLINKYAQ
jgi:von Willebrand factor type A domain